MSITATIYKSTGSWYDARTADGRTFPARIRGVFRLEGISTTNPIAVGDLVDLEQEPDGEGAVITAIHPRKNYIIRRAPAQRNQRHIVAANMDQAVVFATLREPRTSTGFIDRFLVTCEAYHIPANVVFNKKDLYRQKEMQRYAELERIYQAAGYRVFLTSVKEKTGLQELHDVLRDQTSLLSGHSGVGKTSLINALFPSFNLRTRAVSEWSGKGMHTTTFAAMFDLPGGGRIIDTPGMREFGLVDIGQHELSHYFPEMRALLRDCQFNNCLHLHEPGCAIKQAVEAGRLPEDRYQSYANMLDSLA